MGLEFYVRSESSSTSIMHVFVGEKERFGETAPMQF